MESKQTEANKVNELKNTIESMAKDEGKSELEVISMLQFAAAKIGDNETLDALCELKWEYI